MMIPNKGLLIILSGPSGAGKDSVLEILLNKHSSLKKSVSMTTRKIRKGETDGIDYFFVDKDTFENEISENNMLEYAVYNGNYYGTPQNAVDNWLAEGFNVILKIDVQGFDNISHIYENCISIFISPPNIKVLESRLRRRNSDLEVDVIKRLSTSKNELEYIDKYKYLVVNDDLNEAVESVEAILIAECLKSSNNKNFLNEVFYNV